LENAILQLREIANQKLNAIRSGRSEIIRGLIGVQIKIVNSLIKDEKFKENFDNKLKAQIFKLDRQTYNVDLTLFLQIMKERDTLENLDHILNGQLKNLKEVLSQVLLLLRVMQEEAKKTDTALLEKRVADELTRYQLLDMMLESINKEITPPFVKEYYEDMKKLSYNKKTIKLGQVISTVVSKGLRIVVNVEGPGTVPPSGACILCPRHFNALTDGLIIFRFIPRKVFLLTATDFYLMLPVFQQNIKRLLQKLGSQFVARPDDHYKELGLKRNQGLMTVSPEKIAAEKTNTPKAIRNLAIHLKYGDAVMIFPEGDQKINSTYIRSKNEDIILPHPGFVFLAKLAYRNGQHVPIIPIGLNYSRGFAGLGHTIIGATSFVRMKIGNPFFYRDFVSDGEDDEIQKAMLARMYKDLRELSLVAFRV